MTGRGVAFAYGGAQSQQLYAIGGSSFRYTVWLLAMIPRYGILRLAEHGIGADSSLAKPPTVKAIQPTYQDVFHQTKNPGCRSATVEWMRLRSEPGSGVAICATKPHPRHPCFDRNDLFGCSSSFGLMDQPRNVKVDLSISCVTRRGHTSILKASIPQPCFTSHLHQLLPSLLLSFCLIATFTVSYLIATFTVKPHREHNPSHHQAPTNHNHAFRLLPHRLTF